MLDKGGDTAATGSSGGAGSSGATRSSTRVDAAAEVGPEAWVPVDEVRYRAAMARFASGITVTTTRVDGVDHAMTASAFTSVSLDPPLVLVCVEKVARFHSAVLASGSWGVSVLAAGDHVVATWLATRGRSLATQLDGVPTWRGVTGAPLLAGAIATLECRTWAVHDGGDHSIVVGEVVAADVGDDARASQQPLVYFTGDYYTTAVSVDRRQ